MAKITFDERIEKAFHAFFEDETDRSHFPITNARHGAAIALEPTFTEKVDKWTGIVREILLFGPGTFSLFYLTLGIAFFFPAYGISSQGLLLFLFGVFLTYAGSGSIKRYWNLAVPAAVIAIALGLVLFSSLFALNDLSNMYFWYSIYLFPFVLIAGKLVQRWVADREP